MLNPISEILADFKAGKFVILVDDEARENEGDLIMAADFITPQAVNFMAREARGLICLSMSAVQVERLKIPMMTSKVHQVGMTQTAFTMSIEASSGVTTGISAADRAHTIFVASRPDAKPQDIICPGHIFPLRANPEGVLGRNGHTEASVDLAKLCGFNLASVICEVINEDGSMARLPDLRKFADKFNLKVGSIAELIEYRRKNEQ